MRVGRNSASRATSASISAWRRGLRGQGEVRQGDESGNATHAEAPERVLWIWMLATLPG
jgi:hypothetical protein